MPGKSQHLSAAVLNILNGAGITGIWERSFAAQVQDR